MADGSLQGSYEYRPLVSFVGGSHAVSHLDRETDSGEGKRACTEGARVQERGGRIWLTS